ncbi:MAG: hypothetical protein WBH20_11550 [Oceanisphaera sp.]|uniref:hypothetical protein n=1 Tax=Oceanisphaera sp. TaxID=1929979 RepID=UPI003C74A477
MSLSQSSFRQQVRQQVQQSREQLTANPRLGWGLWCLLLIALLYVNLVLRDSRDSLTLNLYSLQQRAAELGVGQGVIAENSPSTNGDQNVESSWPERLAQAKAALTAQETFFGQADSEALARADVQANVNSLLLATGLKRSRIEVSAAPQVNLATGLVPLQLKVSGQARGEQLLTLLGGLEYTKPSYSISSLNAIQGQNSEWVNYSLLATVWYQPFEAQP